MRERARGTHVHGMCTHRQTCAARRRQRAQQFSVWLYRIYRWHVYTFCLRLGALNVLAETTYREVERSSIRIELWRARIRTGCYQVNGQSLAACILIKEAHFFQL